MEDVLLAILVLLTCACLALASVVVFTVAVVMKDWLRPPQAPSQAAPPGELDDMVNGAVGWDDTDPTDHVMPPTMFPQRAVHPSMRYDLIDTGDGNAIDPNLTVDQLQDGPDEPTILADGTIILHGEVIKEGNWDG